MAADTDICNLALTRVGQAQFITSLDTSVDTSANAALCAGVYPILRDLYLTRHRWAFATLSTTLIQATASPGWAYAFFKPSSMLLPLYIFNGSRPGALVQAQLDSGAFHGVTDVSLLPAINGQGSPVEFEQNGAFILTDYGDPIAAWDPTVSYSILQAVTFNGFTFQSAINSNVNHQPSSSGASDANWTASTNTVQCTLFYVAALTSAFPAHFADALAWRLAVDLTLRVATRPQVALGIRAEAEASWARALAIEGNARQGDPRPDSSFIAVRG